MSKPTLDELKRIACDAAGYPADEPIDYVCWGPNDAEYFPALYEAGRRSVLEQLDFAVTPDDALTRAMSEIDRLKRELAIAKGFASCVPLMQAMERKDLELTIQNEHKLYADAWARYENAESARLAAEEENARLLAELRTASSDGFAHGYACRQAEVEALESKLTDALREKSELAERIENRSVKRARDCAHCGSQPEHVSKYDRFACRRCNRWTEPACGCKPEDNCPFPQSPEKPFDEVEAFRRNECDCGNCWICSGGSL